MQVVHGYAVIGVEIAMRLPLYRCRTTQIGAK
jgi:hypothetical protein